MTRKSTQDPNELEAMESFLDRPGIELARPGGTSSADEPKAPGLKSPLHEITAFIKWKLKRTAEDAWQIGRALRLAKAKLKKEKRSFGDYLKGEFELSERTAQRYMEVSELPPDAVTGMKLTALYAELQPEKPAQNSAQAQTDALYQELKQSELLTPASSTKPDPSSKPSPRRKKSRQDSAQATKAERLAAAKQTLLEMMDAPNEWKAEIDTNYESLANLASRFEDFVSHYTPTNHKSGEAN